MVLTTLHLRLTHLIIHRVVYLPVMMTLLDLVGVARPFLIDLPLMRALALAMVLGVAITNLNPKDNNIPTYRNLSLKISR